MGYSRAASPEQSATDGKIMTTAAAHGRMISELYRRMEKTPKLEHALGGRVEAIKLLIGYETAETAEDAMAMLVNGINEANLLASLECDDSVAAEYRDRIDLCLYGVLEFLEKTAGISRDDFGGNYLLMKGESEPRRRLGVIA